MRNTLQNGDFEFVLGCVLQRSPTVKQLRESLKKRDVTISKEEEELAEGGQEAPCSYLTDTYCDLLGYTSPYIYDQAELTTTERRINQIYMLQVPGEGVLKKSRNVYTNKCIPPKKVRSSNDRIVFPPLSECRILSIPSGIASTPNSRSCTSRSCR